MAERAGGVSLKLLSVCDTAELLNISEKTVRREITAGSLEAIRVGPKARTLRIPEDALKRYIGHRRT